jgi:tRNA 2-selenouridine synthase
MSLSSIDADDALARLDRFSAVIDARSPAEYALDRMPGAVNWPSLDDAERAQIGTEYKQVSPFAARKRGAAIVARNVAMHIERHVLDLPREWSPLIYCWRGGQRSGALALVLGQIGFRVQLLEGGYQRYRRAVIASLETLPAGFQFRVVCGPTGSGKSRLLHALAAAASRCSTSRRWPTTGARCWASCQASTQPSQKAFDSRVWERLRRFDPARPVWIESESRKVGDLRVPEALIERMRSAPCVWLELPIERSVELLLGEYDFFVADSEAFCARLDALRVLRGKATVERWQELARAGENATVVRELLDTHYDPIYLQSLRRNFSAVAAPGISVAWDGSPSGLAEAASAAIDIRT